MSHRVATRTDPLNHAASYQYNTNNDVTQITDRNSQAAARLTFYATFSTETAMPSC